ncbi:winged helix-turn-helix transcriptional regulator [Halobium salinum]|uniref:Winged helix-turn-helix transcriptional regulator n=1 Tax=Halobium salinum TaxID=1364940 RepID=A0ABD5P704_9EURY|nr:winged helix-turn-helix transcriptional regulator [Halobium salinum]
MSAPEGERSNVDLFGNLLGRKWNLDIVRTLLEEGPLGFSELAREVDGVSNKVLSESLTDLQEKGLVSRRVVDDRPFRVQYSVTGHGESLRSVVDAIEAWGAPPGRIATCRTCETELPVARECSYCAHHYCAEHQLPENHDCAGVKRLEGVGRRFESALNAAVRAAEPVERSGPPTPTDTDRHERG